MNNHERTGMQQAIDIERFVPVRPTVCTRGANQKSWLDRFEPPRWHTVSEKSKVEFCTQLAVMLQARVSLHRALEVLSRQAGDHRMKKVIEHLGNEVRKGNSFSKALRSRPDVFEELFVVSADVGQESGRLPEVLSHLAQHLEKMSALKRKVMQAMTYPALVISVALCAVTFLFVFIVPTFAEMFKNFQVDLPPTTRVALDISGFLTAHGSMLVLGSIVGAFFFVKIISSKRFRENAERVILRIPLFGDLVRKNHVARFCRTLGTLLESQVSLVDALGVSQRISSNDDIKEEIGEILKHVKQGRAVAEPMVGSRFFPPLVAQMITVGEETSELDSMLLKVADYYEKELDGRVDALSSVIEPVIILLLGMLVAIILISMYMPMFELVNVVGGV